MLRSVRELHGERVKAIDGEIGHVDDFLFDDQSGTIRYLVVDAGSWLTERKVLISPQALGTPDVRSHRFHVNLTREQVENSPDIDTDQPVSRQHEMELIRYYQWTPYWPDTVTALVPPPMPMNLDVNAEEAQEDEEQKKHEGDPHLRSAREIFGYHIQGLDGEVGHVDDLLVDDSDWALRLVVADTRNWWPGGQVLLARESVQRVSWRERKIHVVLTQEEIREAPKFDAAQVVNRAYDPSMLERQAAGRR